MAGTEKTLSIRLSPDGLYYGDGIREAQMKFVPAHPDDAAAAIGSAEWIDGYGRANIIVDTDKVALVPEEFRRVGVEWLGNSGIALPPSHVEVSGGTTLGVFGAMAVRRDVHEALGGRLAAVDYYSPLQINLLRSSTDTLYLNMAHFAYITVTGAGLLRYAALPADGYADILCHVTGLRSEMGLGKCKTVVAGHGAVRLAGSFRRYFPRVTVDKHLHDALVTCV